MEQRAVSTTDAQSRRIVNVERTDDGPTPIPAGGLNQPAEPCSAAIPCRWAVGRSAHLGRRQIGHVSLCGFLAAGAR